MRVLRALWSSLLLLSVVAALLLTPAGVAPGGTWVWARALALLGVLSAIVVAAQVAMAVFRPANFDVRQSGFVADKAKRQSAIDALGLFAYATLLAGWLVLIPADVFVLHLLPSPPDWAAVLGLLSALLGLAVAYSAVWQNQFAAPTIHDQPEQRVVDSGVYGLIRHPLYTGNLMLFAGSAVWLGSTAAAVATVVQLAATLWRIRMEEAYLRQTLPEYTDYVRRVRARLIPFIL